MLDRLLRLRDVMGIAGLSRVTIYRLIARGEFPVGVRVSTGGVR